MRMLTPERSSLRNEAIQLREYGWTQQQIANALNLPQRTISYWLSRPIMGVSSHNILAKDFSISKNGTHDVAHIMEILNNVWVDSDLSRQYALEYQTKDR